MVEPPCKLQFGCPTCKACANERKLNLRLCRPRQFKLLQSTTLIEQSVQHQLISFKISDPPVGHVVEGLHGIRRARADVDAMPPTQGCHGLLPLLHGALVGSLLLLFGFSFWPAACSLFS